jgi:pyrroloquinoline quinone biosynthesis protein B
MSITANTPHRWGGRKAPVTFPSHPRSHKQLGNLTGIAGPAETTDAPPRTGIGGGIPQRNCNCSNCRRMRQGKLRAQPRTQSSITVSANGVDWVLFNASPDIRAQFAAFPAMQPGRALRDTALRAMVLIDSEIDHSTGLMMLREKGSPLDVYCTEQVQPDLTHGYPVFRALDPYCGLNWHRLVLEDDTQLTIPGAKGLGFTAVPLTSEPPHTPPPPQHPAWRQHRCTGGGHP